MKSFKCCHDCIAPKRHLGCHSDCPEYLAEKEYREKEVEWLREENKMEVEEYSFNKCAKLGNHRSRTKPREV